MADPRRHALPPTGPSLDALARDPGQAAQLAPELRQALVLQALAVLAALAMAPVGGNGQAPLAPLEADGLLTPEEAAALLRVPVSWVYRQGRRLKAGQSTAIPLQKRGKYLRVPRAALLAQRPELALAMEAPLPGHYGTTR